MQPYYEHIFHTDKDFPVIFHLDTLAKDDFFISHWSKNIELLYVTEGEIIATIDEERICASVGDIVIINSDMVHHVASVTECSSYYCLIIDKALCIESKLYSEEFLLQSLVTDSYTAEVFEKIISEYSRSEKYYKTAIKAYTMLLLTHLYRSFSTQGKELKVKTHTTHIDTVRKCITYIQENYAEPISLDELSLAVGYSKYYLLHSFKRVTGSTIVAYLNLFRCLMARDLITDGKGMKEVATLCGFQNLSYFTRTYKKFMGVSPSQDRK